VDPVDDRAFVISLDGSEFDAGVDGTVNQSLIDLR
jgi:hypothetical protein